MANLSLRALVLSTALFCAATAPAFAKAPPAKPVWTTAWASAQMIADGKNALPAEDFTDATLRQVVRITAGGQRFKLKFSNLFGTRPLHINAASVARAVAPGKSAILADSAHTITFNGRGDVTIPAGAEYTSDVIAMTVAPLTDLAITTWQSEAPSQQTGHPGSRTTSFVVHGNHVTDNDFEGSKTVDHWYQISAIELESTTTRGAIAILGDSITDGYGTVTNGNTRWPDYLMQRLAEAKIPLSVLNQGIGGNRLLLDGNGPNAMARLDRDVLSQTNVRYLIVLEGINDLGMATHEGPISAADHEALVKQLIGAYRQIVDRARARGIKAIGATVMPFSGSDYYKPDATNEADRQAINAWIRTPGNFDSVIDFDAFTRDPNAPDHLKAEYDSGDHLHPSVPGYKAMASFVPLNLFTK